MNKKYPDSPKQSSIAAEPSTTFGIQDRLDATKKRLTSKEKILARTVSVDNYFDELITLVIKDHENL
ncbi:MAG: hypothetical protein IJL45_06080 [Prevotella sp.]|nr:hypothetical protein [Prevotella sp.]MBQ6187247.1 hypothetical protein [Prevotella sp.]